MTPGIRVRQLQLRGAGRTYDVSFLDGNKNVRPLSVIAGEIATGKTSILEFIDYCLGASRHPRHPEIERRVSAALLEVEIGGEIAVIERPLHSYSRALVHQAALDELPEYHDIQEKTFRRASDPDSLSQYLLEACDLGGRQLKQAPTQDASAVDPMSFRDLSDLFFLPHRRLDNLELLHERHQPKRLKLRQTIDVIFGAHDDALVAANSRLDEVREEISDLELEIDTIVSFLAEQGVDEDADLAMLAREAETDLVEVREALNNLEQRMEAETASADELRLVYESAVDEVNRTTVSLRDRETLIKRLGALRAQYADDLTKLRFAARAGHLFDPLSLTACPSCLQPLEKPVTPADGACGLCAQPLRGLDDDTAFDVSKEIRTTETKLRELTTSIEEIESTVLQLQVGLDSGAQRRDAARTELDAAVSGRLAPFIAERDVVQNRVATAEQRRSEIARSRSFVAGIDDRRKRLAGLEREEARLKDRVAHLKEQGQDHVAVVSALSDRFGTILADFQFPKLDDPHLDEVFVPHVRGIKYGEIGSAGATTLISLAWHLAIFEVAAEQEATHPGILMIDSPQKNLLGESEPDFDGHLIADSVYEHMIRWSGSEGRSQQLILVDNSPRPSAEHHVVVRYSGDADRPPYGLIDDEVS